MEIARIANDVACGLNLVDEMKVPLDHEMTIDELQRHGDPGLESEYWSVDEHGELSWVESPVDMGDDIRHPSKMSETEWECLAKLVGAGEEGALDGELPPAVLDLVERGYAERFNGEQGVRRFRATANGNAAWWMGDRKPAPAKIVLSKMELGWLDTICNTGVVQSSKISPLLRLEDLGLVTSEKGVGHSFAWRPTEVGHAERGLQLAMLRKKNRETLESKPTKIGDISVPFRIDASGANRAFKQLRDAVRNAVDIRGLGVEAVNRVARDIGARHALLLGQSDCARFYSMESSGGAQVKFALVDPTPSVYWGADDERQFRALAERCGVDLRKKNACGNDECVVYRDGHDCVGEECEHASRAHREVGLSELKREAQYLRRQIKKEFRGKRVEWVGEPTLSARRTYVDLFVRYRVAEKKGGEFGRTRTACTVIV